MLDGQQLSFSCERKQIMLEKNNISPGLVGKYVETYGFADRGPRTDFMNDPAVIARREKALARLEAAE